MATNADLQRHGLTGGGVGHLELAREALGLVADALELAGLDRALDRPLAEARLELLVGAGDEVVLGHDVEDARGRVLVLEHPGAHLHRLPVVGAQVAEREVVGVVDRERQLLEVVLAALGDEIVVLVLLVRRGLPALREVVEGDVHRLGPRLRLLVHLGLGGGGVVDSDVVEDSRCSRAPVVVVESPPSSSPVVAARRGQHEGEGDREGREPVTHWISLEGPPGRSSMPEPRCRPGECARRPADPHFPERRRPPSAADPRCGLHRKAMRSLEVTAKPMRSAGRKNCST